MIAAITWLSFAALAFSCFACLFLAIWLFLSHICRDIEHEAEHGFKLPESRDEKRMRREGGAK